MFQYSVCTSTIFITLFTLMRMEFLLYAWHTPYPYVCAPNSTHLNSTSQRIGLVACDVVVFKGIIIITIMMMIIVVFLFKKPRHAHTNVWQAYYSCALNLIWWFYPFWIRQLNVNSIFAIMFFNMPCHFHLWHVLKGITKHKMKRNEKQVAIAHTRNARACGI